MTQHAQAQVLRITIEALRKVKYRPTGGFCAFYLADPSPAGGFGIFDSQRRPKPAWHAVVDACRPVIVVSDSPPPVVRTGERLLLPVHVVSDLHDALIDGVVTATVTHADGSTTTQRWGGAVGPDTCEHIATLAIEPNHTGELVIDLAFEATGSGGHVAATNRYSTTVA